MVAFLTYQVLPEQIEKAACMLIEKCYANGLKLVVLVQNDERRDSIDKTLWTFSQKKFIPHGTNLDDFAELQPIYITTNFSNPNNATCLLALGKLPDDSTLQNSNYERIMIMYQEDDQPLKVSIKNYIDKFKLAGNIIHYKQTGQGNWEKFDL